MFASKFYKPAAVSTILSIMVPVASVILALTGIGKVTDRLPSRHDEEVDDTDNAEVIAQGESQAESIESRFHIQNALVNDDYYPGHCIMTRFSYSMNQISRHFIGNRVISPRSVQHGSSSVINENVQSKNCGQTVADGSRSLGWHATDKGMSSNAILDAAEEVKNFFPEPTLFNVETDGDVEGLFKRKDADRSRADGE